ncbi:ankyrin repeat domain-containing protein, partial [Aspergillus fijiensis CBS 313.89]
MATEAGNVGAVELRLAAGANPDFTGPWKVTPISIAVCAGYMSILHLLLAMERVNVNCQNLRGLTPLIEAVERGNLEIVKFLLDAKNVDKNIMDFEGRTPLALAENNGDDYIADLLRDHGCANL